MAKIMNKFFKYIGIEGTEDDDTLLDEQDDLYYENEQEIADESNVVSMGNRGKSRSKVVGLPTSGNVKVIVYRPVCYEETQSIIDNLKSRKSVIVNMEDLEISCAQRILDFMSGAIYALNGTIFKVSKGIFVVAPMNVDVVGNDREDEAAGEGY
jgi:cell division inhibitor SepF